MGRRNEHTREQQREMAVSAAEMILVKSGIEGVSMRKVAGAIGYTAGQLYLLFKNQDELFVVLNERTAESIYSALRDAVDERSLPRTRLNAGARAYIEFAQRHPNRWRLMYEHRMPEGVEMPKANILRVKRLFDLVEDQLAAAAPGLSRKALKEAATALWSGVHGICVLAVTGKLVWSGVTDYARLSDLLVENFIAGLNAD